MSIFLDFETALNKNKLVLICIIFCTERLGRQAGPHQRVHNGWICDFEIRKFS